jgi:hypothetical protein
VNENSINKGAEMSGLGTDVLALACIAGGAAMSGTATMAWFGDQPSRAEAPLCMVEASTVAGPAVIVTRGRGQASTVVVSSTGARAGNLEACGRAVRVERVRTEALVREAARARADAARVRAEVARARAEVARARANAEVARARADAERRKR